jgi:membrane-bound serine protease (ClpP class)
MVLAVILLVVGVALVVAEVLFVSFGLLALLAGACILAADLIAFGHSDAMGWTFVAAEVVLVPLALWGAFRVLPRLPFGRRMLLEASGPWSPAVPDWDRLLGKRGAALTDLRPAGTAEFDGERVSVVSVGGIVPKGAALVVVSVEGMEVRVRPAPDGAST